MRVASIGRYLRRRSVFHLRDRRLVFRALWRFFVLRLGAGLRSRLPACLWMRLQVRSKIGIESVPVDRSCDLTIDCMGELVPMTAIVRKGNKFIPKLYLRRVTCLAALNR